MTQGVLVQLKVSTQILPGLILDIQDPNDQMGVSENVVPPNSDFIPGPFGTHPSGNSVSRRGGSFFVKLHRWCWIPDTFNWNRDILQLISGLVEDYEAAWSPEELWRPSYAFFVRSLLPKSMLTNNVGQFEAKKERQSWFLHTNIVSQYISILFNDLNWLNICPIEVLKAAHSHLQV